MYFYFLGEFDYNGKWLIKEGRKEWENEFVNVFVRFICMVILYFLCYVVYYCWFGYFKFVFLGERKSYVIYIFFKFVRFCCFY